MFPLTQLLTSVYFSVLPSLEKGSTVVKTELFVYFKTIFGYNENVVSPFVKKKFPINNNQPSRAEIVPSSVYSVIQQ